MSCRVIAIANQKGGVGKTTTTLNLGAALAEKGRRVLLVDLDQQGNLTTSCGLNVETVDRTSYTVLVSYASGKEADRLSMTAATYEIPAIGVDLVPGNMDLAVLDRDLQNAYRREFALQRALSRVRDLYDYILLDCPPSLSLVVTNALAAADEVLIPLQAQFLASRGVRLLLDTISVAQSELNPSLKVAGILLTMVDTRTTHSREVVSVTQADYAGVVPVFDTIIRVNVRLQEAPITGTSILKYDSTSAAATAYRLLAEEVEHAVVA